MVVHVLLPHLTAMEHAEPNSNPKPPSPREWYMYYRHTELLQEHPYRNLNPNPPSTRGGGMHCCTVLLYCCESTLTP